MEFEYLANIIRRDSYYLVLMQLREKLLTQFMQTACTVIVNQEDDGSFCYVITSDVDTQLAEIENSIYERIKTIVYRAIENGYPKKLGELFLDKCKPTPRKHLTENIVLI